MSVCRDCGQSIEKIDGEWVDAIGVGCSGRGEIGEVLPHRPWYVSNDDDSARFYFDRDVVPLVIAEEPALPTFDVNTGRSAPVMF